MRLRFPAVLASLLLSTSAARTPAPAMFETRQQHERRWHRINNLAARSAYIKRHFPLADAGMMPCTECGQPTGGWCDQCPARRRLADRQADQPVLPGGAPRFAMPLCAACDFDDWLGMCHICLDIFEDIYSPVTSPRHTTGPYTPHATGRFSQFRNDGLGALTANNEGLVADRAVPVRDPEALPYHDGWQQRIPQFDPEDDDDPMDTDGPVPSEGQETHEG